MLMPLLTGEHYGTNKETILKLQSIMMILYHKNIRRQARFLIFPSEEAFYGGQAGGGKSSALLMSALQYVEEKHIPEDENKLKYNALIIRRTLEDLDMPDAIMDRAKQWLLPKEDEGLLVWEDQKKRFIFNSGATLTFRYLSHNKYLNSYQGVELQFVGFDELISFPKINIIIYILVCVNLKTLIFNQDERCFKSWGYRS